MPSRHLSSSSTSSASASASAATIAVILTLIIIIILFFYLIYRRRRSRTIPRLIHNTTSHRFPYNHLLAATNSFSPNNIIGKGASATVYRGVLPNGKSVAVKLINLASGLSSSSSAQIEFENELRILSRLASPYVVPLLGYSVKNNHRILVYEYMPNRSLQETLFAEKFVSLGWDHRFRIVQDVARALAYLHLECDPPIIHGDVKPSNVLLDMDFRARVSDFGLSRVKEVEEVEEEFGAPFSQELSGNLVGAAAEVVEAGSSRHYGYNEVDFARALQASASPKSECMLKDHLVMVDDSVIDENSNGEVGRKRDQGICCEDGVSGAYCIGDDLEEGRSQWGKDWWWRQDGSGELCSKDYVTEWIGSQICHGSNDDNNHAWDDDEGEKSASHQSPMCNDSGKLQMGELGLAMEQGRNQIGGRDNKMHRKLHEWWGEEHPVEISKTLLKLRNFEKKWSKSFKKPILSLSRSVKLRRKPKFVEHDGGTHYCDPDLDFSFGRGSKKNKKSHSEGSELWSGDQFSRELSSTTSMRGTLCYMAPECGGGCGYLMEKADIYSFGVLILVILSGRRPLHVLSSPMKLEKANLVSWCRQLAQSGNLLELVDKRLKTQGYSEVQATLCINLALSCLQKMPELRPDIGDVVKVLDGEMDLPALPFELSTSPPPKLLSRSRSRQKAKGG